MMEQFTGPLSTADIKALLLEHDVRPTRQRIEIARVLLLQPQHLSADQVQVRVNRKARVVSKATVYNTLNLFAGKGLIRQVIIAPGKIFYDSNTRDHHHFYHEDTGLLQDIERDEMTIRNMPDLPPGTVESGVDIVIRLKKKKGSE